jgi:hypothetical protein
MRRAMIRVLASTCVLALTQACTGQIDGDASAGPGAQLVLAQLEATARLARAEVPASLSPPTEFCGDSTASNTTIPCAIPELMV